MKKYVLLTAVVLSIAAPSLAWSQSNPGGFPPQGSQGGGHEGNGQEFQERKANILKRMNEHLAEVQQRIGCVQAANNHEALRACMPERHEGGHGGEHEGHGER